MRSDHAFGRRPYPGLKIVCVLSRARVCVLSTEHEL